MKVYIEESFYIDVNTCKTLYFIFKKSKAEHKALKEFHNNSKEYYWFKGLTGKGWFMGGFYISPIINPHNHFDLDYGFTDGKDVYLLNDIREKKPINIKPY